MAIPEISRREIRGIVASFVDSYIAKLSAMSAQAPGPGGDAQGRLKPFHEAILAGGLATALGSERSFSTALGKTFEAAARVIASTNSDEARTQVRVSGTFSVSTLARIEEVRGTIERRGMAGGYATFVDQIAGGLGTRSVQDSVVADLYVRRGDARWFIEMKSAKPNQSQCLDATVKLLKFHAMEGGPPRVHTFYAMPYNPYGTREAYNHPFALKLLDMRDEVLLGSEFWEFLGGPGTERELLDIYAAVGQVKSQAIVAAMD